MTISELIEERGLKGACTECNGNGCHWCYWTGEDHLNDEEAKGN
jgi:hypothetical protein